ncbi:MAG: BatA domain-containing protein [Bacteroidia bacterium]
MSFLYPQFLWALLALAIPVIIHFFNFRRYKKLYFPNVRFLTEVEQESKSRNKLKHWLLLLTRLMALSLLVLAFAQPFNPDAESAAVTGRNAVSIYVDNSFSLTNASEEGTLLQQANNLTEDIAWGYGESDLFNIITNTTEHSITAFRPRREFIDNLPGLQESAVTRSLQAVVSQQEQLLSSADAPNYTSYLVSDFQKSMMGDQLPVLDSNVNYYLVPLEGAKTQNLYIDSAWYESPIFQPGQPVELKVRIRNFGNEAVTDNSIKLNVNGRQKGLATFGAGGDESITVNLSHTVDETGWNRGVLSIEDYPVTFDNDYYFSFFVKEQQRVLIVNNSQVNPFLRAVFSTDPYSNLTNTTAGNLDYSTFPEYDLIILNELPELSSGLVSQIGNYVRDGGNLFVVPPDEESIVMEGYNNLLASLNAGQMLEFSKKEARVQNINFEHPVYRNVFEDIPENINLPVVQQHFDFRVFSRSRMANLLPLNDGGFLLAQFDAGDGNFYMASTPFREGYTNFPRHGLFVPTLYKLAVYKNRSVNLAYFIGNDNLVEVRRSLENKDQVLVLRKDEFEVVPDQRYVNGRFMLTTGDNLTSAGFYDLIPAGPYVESVPLATLAFNFSRSESELDFYSAEELKERFAGQPNVRVLETTGRDLSLQLADISSGTGLWKWLILAVIIFLLGETMLVKFMRK